MRIKNIKIIISVILLFNLFFLSSCSSNEKDVSYVDYDFKKGYGGLDITFLDNYPPERIFTNSDFTIAVNLENNGAYDIYNGEIKLLGLNQNYFYLFDDPPVKSLPFSSGSLNGKNLNNPSGDNEFVEFVGEVLNLDEGREEESISYFIKVDYDYSNELVHDVCINPSTYGTYNAGCNEQSVTRFKGQGSPVSVTEIEQITNSGYNSEVKFIITIKNEGSGQMNGLQLYDVSLGGDSLDCEFKGFEGDYLIFEKGEEEVILLCTFSISSSSSYETTLYVLYHFSYEIKKIDSFIVLSN